MNYWNSSVQDLESSLGCALANGGLTTHYLTGIEIAESACRFPRSSILCICKTYRNKLAKATKERIRNKEEV